MTLNLQGIYKLIAGNFVSIPTKSRLGINDVKAWVCGDGCVISWDQVSSHVNYPGDKIQEVE